MPSSTDWFGKPEITGGAPRPGLNTRQRRRRWGRFTASGRIASRSTTITSPWCKRFGQRRFFPIWTAALFRRFGFDFLFLAVGADCLSIDRKRPKRRKSAAVQSGGKAPQSKAGRKEKERKRGR